ncbi:hypothetical protein APHAL10511_007294 [Amanita phalloides]|nr:hypothetical protein APHAL10511_007294 [Amanita phalloides]
MSEDPTSLARDANHIHQSLKELLTTNEPYDKEVEFLRKKLRRQYLQLLLVHPRVQESKDAENHLWMQTSYAFIAAYKQRINTLDRLINNRPQQSQPSQQQQQQQQQQRQSGPGPVEYRKLLQRFRQFLAEEEKFWAKLVGRLYRTFALTDARPALQAVGIPLEEEQPQAGANSTGHGRNQQQFPPEDLTPRVEARNTNEKDAYISTLSKALVFLGDVARYRELYNEAGGRPKAGHEDGTPARRRNRRGPTWLENIAKARNYDKAQQYYEQARLLVPNEGKPSHQLAILASYKDDAYASLLHYYRALCVKQSYDTALNNMGILLNKTLDRWRTSAKHDKNKNLPLDANLHPGVRVDKFKERLVVLHALWRVGSESGVDKMNSIVRKLDVAVAHDFTTLVGQRQMPDDMIMQAIAMSQGALWKYRMRRDTTNDHHNGSSSSSVLLEWYIVKHVLDMHRALLEIGRDELNVPPSHDTKDDLGQQITATFRRTLPALRVASKWLRANTKYLSQDPEFSAYVQKKKGVIANNSLHQISGHPHQISGHSYHTRRFWEMYAEFSRTLARTFPLSKLPKLTAPLEEDIELGGFLPLKRLMNDIRTDDQGRIKPREEVHPNDEQLMRIADLHEDSKAISEFEYAPIQFYSISGVVMLDNDAFEAEIPKVKTSTARQQEEQEEQAVTRQQVPPGAHMAHLDTKTDQEDSLSDNSPDDDDDVVRNAFRHLDDQVEDEDEEQIVYDPRPVVSPAIQATASPPAQISPISPPRQPVSPVALEISPQSLSRHNGVPSRGGLTTAEDLLRNVMGGARPPPPQQPHIFSSNLSAQSIWSTSQDEQRILAGAAGHVSGSPLFPSPTHQYSTLDTTHSFDLPSLSHQSIWGPPSPFISGGFNGTQQSINVNATGIGLNMNAGGPFPQQFAQHGMAPSNGIGDRSNLLHSRVPSLSPVQLQLQQQYQIQTPLSLSLSNGSHGLNMSEDTSFGLSMDDINLAEAIDPRGAFYNNNYRNGSSPFHTRHLSYNDPRLGTGIHQPLSPSLWGNT